MSFRYTNFLIGTFTQRILLHRALTKIATRTYVGRSAGGAVTVTSNAYGKILDIQVDEAAKAQFVDTATGVVNNAAALSQAMRVALFDINMKVRQDKEESFSESIRNSPEMLKNDHYKMWFEHNGGSLAPFVYEAIRDEPLFEPLKQQQQEENSPSSTPNANSNVLGKARAKKINSMAACMPEYAGSLLQLEDPIVVNEKQKMRYDDGERAFWQRVDLIRRAQMNTMGTSKKRNYEEFEVRSSGTSANGGAFSEKTKLSFVR